MVLDLGVPERKSRSQWPNLRVGQFESTSEADPYYNCVAWAMRDKRQWWEPSGWPEHYWPNKATPDYSLQAYTEAFETRHYIVCDDGEAEPGYEKIAIYWNADGFRHVARQLADGQWTSKLGEAKDIAHPSLDDLTGDYYGEPVRFMRRPRAQGQAQARPRRTRARQRRTRS